MSNNVMSAQKIERYKRKVERLYRQEGEIKARKTGRQLGLSDGLLARWFLSWSTQTSTPDRPKNLRGKRRVCFKGSKHHLKHLGTIVCEGPEQSEVLWDLGYTQYVNNDNIITVGDEHGNRERQTASENDRQNKKVARTRLVGK